METDNRGIIVVDDEPHIRDLVANVLSDSGYLNVFTANDGLDCIKVIAEKGESIYLVIIDQVMSRMSGIETIDYLTKVHPFVVGFIMISGHIDIIEYEKQVAKLDNRSGIVIDFVAKPFDMESIIAETARSLALIDSKRKKQAGQIMELLQRQLEYISNKMLNIDNKLDRLLSSGKGIKGFLNKIGHDVIVAIVLGLFVLLFLYLGIDEFIKGIISKVNH